MPPNQHTPIVDRFNANWIPEPNSGCWLWLGAAAETKHGGLRGRMNCDGRVTLAYRVSWGLHRGPIPDGLLVLHKCDVPLCVNPDHLFLGTQRDNVQDMIAKGRRNTRPCSAP